MTVSRHRLGRGARYALAAMIAAPGLSPLAAAGTAGAASAVSATALPIGIDTVLFRDGQGQFDAARFDTLTASALRTLLEEAAARGLPTAPLINRALEGAARRVGGARILTVVRAHAAALADAKAALGDRSSVAELDAGATAIRAGVDAQVLAAVRSARPLGAAVTPLVVLTDVVRRGVPAETARDAVTAIAGLPRADEVLLGLQATVAKNAQRGPGMAVDALHRYVRASVAGVVSPSTSATGDRKPVRPPLP
jgi:hypothetical protein